MSSLPAPLPLKNEVTLPSSNESIKAWIDLEHGHHHSQGSLLPNLALSWLYLAPRPCPASPRAYWVLTSLRGCHAHLLGVLGVLAGRAGPASGRADISTGDFGEPSQELNDILHRQNHP